MPIRSPLGTRVEDDPTGTEGARDRARQGGTADPEPAPEEKKLSLRLHREILVVSSRPQ